MKTGKFMFLIAITIVAGLIGGALSNRAFMAKSAVAQESYLLWGDGPANLTKAEYFRLVFYQQFHRHETNEAANSFTAQIGYMQAT